MKQVIVVNQALNLPVGKLAAQVAHAAVAALLQTPQDAQMRWFEEGMPKIVLGCLSEAALLAIADQADQLGIPVARIRDAGRTVVEAGTLTCVGLGPDTPDRIDIVTGALHLLR